MKICISTLLLTINVFLNFDELNASGVPEASTSSSSSQGESLRYVHKDPRDGPPHKFVNIGDQLIQVWLDSSKRNIVKAWYNECAIPQPAYLKNHDLLIRVFVLDGLNLVAYISKSNVLIGVRPPRQEIVHQYMREPSPSLFYVIYSGSTFRLTFNTEIQKVTEISLMPENFHTFWQHKEHVQVASLQFTVFKGGPLNQITGAELGFLKLNENYPVHNVVIKRPKTEQLK